MSKEDTQPMLPGEHVSSIEEFEGGKNTYLASDGTVRSASVGTRVYDLKRRIVKIEQKNSPMLPKVGDIIVGYVEMLFSSMVSTKVLHVHGKWYQSVFTAFASARVGRDAEAD